MAVTIDGPVSALNRAQNTTSYLMLSGTGFSTNPTQDAAVEFTTRDGSSVKWTGTIVFASARGIFGLAELTRAADSVGDIDLSGETQNVTVTVDGTQAQMSVDLYADTTPPT